jgi:hypothetical protein
VGGDTAQDDRLAAAWSQMPLRHWRRTKAYDLTAAQRRLTQRFGAPVTIPAAIDPLVVTTPADVDDAEWRLLRRLVKDTDGFMARHVERPISLRIARRLASTGITPNQITLLSVGIGLCGALFFLSSYWLWQTVGALLFLAHSILDGCDGELARLKFQESRFGGIIDYWGDNVVHIAVFACMAVGWSLSIERRTLQRRRGNPRQPGISLVRLLARDAPKRRWSAFTSVAPVPGQSPPDADAASRRDFIYPCSFLLCSGSRTGFVIAAAGSPIFIAPAIPCAAQCPDGHSWHLTSSGNRAPPAARFLGKIDQPSTQHRFVKLPLPRPRPRTESPPLRR